MEGIFRRDGLESRVTRLVIANSQLQRKIELLEQSSQILCDSAITHAREVKDVTDAKRTLEANTAIWYHHCPSIMVLVLQDDHLHREQAMCDPHTRRYPRSDQTTVSK